MIRKLAYIWALILPLIGISQQNPQYTQYMFNDYAINPAVGGSKDYFEVKSNNRYQWVGITDAPRTFTLSMHGPSKERNMGFGCVLFTDIVGPTRRNGFQASYSYHFNMNESIKLSLGLSVGVLQWLVDGSKITLNDPNDNVISNGLQSALVPDAKFGLYLYEEEKWHFGVSLPNLFQSKLYFFNYQTESLSRLEDHYFMTGSYRFDIGEDFSIEPSLILKYVHPAPLKADIGARFIYQDMVWLGATYRTQDAFSALIGYVFKRNLMIGYSHDFTTTNLRNYSSGTHEIMMGIKFTGTPTAKGDFNPAMF